MLKHIHRPSIIIGMHFVKKTSLSLWLTSALLIVALGLVCFLLVDRGRGEAGDAALAQSPAVHPTQAASEEAFGLAASPGLEADTERRSVAEAKQATDHAESKTTSEPGLSLKLSATWGGLAPISFQGFEIAISSLEIEDAYQATLAAYIEKGSAPIPEGIWRRMQRQGESMPFREIGITDARGEYTFEGLPEGLLRIVPLGNGFDAAQDEREFMLNADCSFQYVADPGLAYGGRVLGEVKDEVHLRLLNTSAAKSAVRSYVLDDDGGFLFRGLDPGTYVFELYDESRWSALKRYAPFVLERDVYDAQIKAPRVGSLSFRVWDLPEGTELTGCYVKRVIDVQKDTHGGNWILNDESGADSCSFDGLSYGEYQLFVRGMHNSDQGGRGQGEILARLNVTLESPEVELEWVYAPAPTVWVRLVGEGRGDADLDDPTRGIPPEALASLRKLVGSSELEDLDRLELRSGGTITILAGESLHLGSSNDAIFGSKSHPGTLTVRTAEGVLQHQQGFRMIDSPEFGRFPFRMDDGQAPFRNRPARMRDGCIELLLPVSTGHLRLRVDLVGYESREVEFEVLNGLTIDAVIEPLGLPDSRPKEDPIFVITGNRLQLGNEGN